MNNDETQVLDLSEISSPRHKKPISNKMLGVLCFLVIPLFVGVASLALINNGGSTPPSQVNVIITGCTFNVEGVTVTFSAQNFSSKTETKVVRWVFRNTDGSVIPIESTTHLYVPSNATSRGSQITKIPKGIRGITCNVES
jgi:hypothetical protein